jgi:glycosyltransferase involved in cell wall biosynthesis
MKVSVVIPCRNEVRYIADCVNSLLDNGYDKELLEILVVDGMSDDGTIEKVHSLQKEYHQVILVPNEKKVTPVALNLGIEHATGDYILIASAHSSFSKGYIQTLVQKIQILENAIAVGGVMKTEVKNSTPTSLAIKTILAHGFGVGNAMFRIGIKDDTKVDTVPFGLYRADLLKATGGYDVRLIRNHDIELSKRLLRSGGSIYLTPSAECTYYAREKFSAMSKNNYNNGKWNILTVFITKNFGSLSVRHFIPLIFLLSLVLPLIAGLIWCPLALLSGISFLTYLLAVLYFSITSGHKGTSIFLIIVGFFVLHLSYGMGSLVGILILPKFAGK